MIFQYIARHFKTPKIIGIHKNVKKHSAGVSAILPTRMNNQKLKAKLKWI